MRNSALKGLLKKKSRTSPLKFAGEMEAAVSGLSRSQRALARPAADLGVELAKSTDWEYKEPVRVSRPISRKRKRGKSNKAFLRALKSGKFKGLEKRFGAHQSGDQKYYSHGGKESSGKFMWGGRDRSNFIKSFDNT